MKYLNTKETSDVAFILMVMFLIASAVFAILGLVVYVHTQLLGVFMLIFVIFLLMALGISVLTG